MTRIFLTSDEVRYIQAYLMDSVGFSQNVTLEVYDRILNFEVPCIEATTAAIQIAHGIIREGNRGPKGQFHPYLAASSIMDLAHQMMNASMQSDSVTSGTNKPLP